MRNRLLSSLAGVAILLAAAPALAGVLTAATWIQTAQVGLLPSVPLTRTTSQLVASGSSTASSIAISLSYPAFSTMFFVPKTSLGVIDLHLTLTQGGAQAITASPSMGGGTPGIPGTAIVMTAVHSAASMFNLGVVTLLKVPLGNGKAGQFTSTFVISGVFNEITVDFFAWTPHTLTFMSLTSKGVALPDVSAMGSFDLTANGGGTVTLVSPSRVSINSSLTQRRTVSITTLKLAFVPEPGTLLLLGAAAIGMLALRRRC